MLRSLFTHCHRRLFAAAYFCLIARSSADPAAVHATNFSKASCDNLASCSPSFCQNVTNKACSFTEPDIDYAAHITKVGCNAQCKQSTAKMCSKESLAAALIIAKDGIKAAFCTDKFLVMWSAGKPNHHTNLAGVPRPPGGSGGSSYPDQCVTRSFIKQGQTFKIPLPGTYSLLPEGVNNTLPSGAALPSINLPMSGAVGVAVNGIPIYPILDNQDLTIYEACESDRCNAHVGRGADYHYHGDPFGTTCMYTEANNSSPSAHPVLIGWGVDGPAIYGRYTSATQPGAMVELDRCGGHVHGEFEYHYHSVVEQHTASPDGLDDTEALFARGGDDTDGRSRLDIASTAGEKFTAYFSSPKYCWRANVSAIENFWMSTSGSGPDESMLNAAPPPPGSPPKQVNYDNSKTNPPYAAWKRNDATQLQPCCGSTEYVVAEGITLPTSNAVIEYL